MRVLYNPTAIKIIFLFFIINFVFAADQFKIYSQTSERRDKIADWSLPFNVCRTKVSLKPNIKSLASDNELSIYISTFDGLLESIDFQTNKSNWVIDLGAEIISNMVIDAKNIYVVSKSSEKEKNDLVKLRAISKLTGITVWQTDLPKTDVIFLRLYENLSVFAGNFIVSINIDKGSKVWDIYQIPFFQTHLDNLQVDSVADLDKSFFTNLLNNNRQILKGNNIIQKDIKVQTENTKVLVIGDKLGNIGLYSKLNGEKTWKRKAGGEITGLLLIKKDELLVSSLDNFLYLFSSKNGDLMWKKRLPFRITEKPLIENDIALVSGNSSGFPVFVIRLDNGKIINRILLPSSVYFLGDFLIIGEKVLMATNTGIFVFDQKPC